MRAALLFAIPSAGRAVVLDWDSLTWTDGSLSQSYDIDPSNPGNDVTITVTSTEFLSGYPARTTNLTGGLSPVQNALQLAVDWSAVARSTTLTVDFNYANGVSAVSYSLFDSDSGTGTTKTWEDEIRQISAYYTTGAWSIAPSSVTSSTASTVTGSGTNYNVRGIAGATDTTGDGNVNFAYTNTIKGFRFTYEPGPNSQSNPVNQWIALHDITFLPVIPEAGVVPAAALAAVAALGFLRRRAAG
jgi:hypothetical protein